VERLAGPLKARPGFAPNPKQNGLHLSIRRDCKSSLTGLGENRPTLAFRHWDRGGDRSSSRLGRRVVRFLALAGERLLATEARAAHEPPHGGI